MDKNICLCREAPNHRLTTTADGKTESVPVTETGNRAETETGTGTGRERGSERENESGKGRGGERGRESATGPQRSKWSRTPRFVLSSCNILTVYDVNTGKMSTSWLTLNNSRYTFTRFFYGSTERPINTDSSYNIFA